MKKSLVIIGGGEAGTYTLEALIKKGPEIFKQFDITLLKREKRGSASICAVPPALQGIFRMDEVVELENPKYFIDHGIDYRTETEATKIDLEGKSVNLSTGEKIKYDYLVIGTGREPRIPKIEGKDLEGVYTFSTIEDGERIEAAMKDSEAKNAVVIGGGSIGIQTAIAFLKKELKTKVVVGHSAPLSSMLDPDMGSIVRESLEKEGLEFIFGKDFSINGDRRVKSVIAGEDKIPADIVVISRGMLPNSDLAKKAGIEIGETGGIATDQYMHVKKNRKYIKDVYALGDCSEVIDGITLRPRLSQLASTALVQAKVIADNLVGINSSFEPCLSPTVATISNFQVGSIGLTSDIAERYCIKIISGKKEKPTKPRFYHGRKSMVVKLLFDAYSKKLIGAQIISEDMVADRIDGLGIAIKKGMTAKELSKMEKSFDPCVSLHRDVIIDVAEEAIR